MNRQEESWPSFNFSDEEQEIEIKCEDIKTLKRVFSSEYKEYGGQEEKKEKIIKAKKEIATLKLKPFSAEYYLIQSMRLKSEIHHNKRKRRECIFTPPFSHQIPCVFLPPRSVLSPPRRPQEGILLSIPSPVFPVV